ncbi:arginase family protein [Nonomuraea antimicrobica]
MLTVVEVPQWQGSSSPTAPRLVEGASRLAAMVPGAARHVRVDAEGTLAETADRVRRALPGDGLTVTVGGDCGVELEPVTAALRRHGDRLTVVWFDAHGDLNTPATSPSGAFHGMILRTLQGEGPSDLVRSPALSPGQIALAGTRSLDPAEADHIRRVGIGGLATVRDDAVLYVHIDLDVLDGIRSVGYPEPGGLSPSALTEAVAALAARHEIVGLGITEYAPCDPGDEEMLRSLVPGLVWLCAASRPSQIERRAARAWPARHTEERDGWLLRHTPGVNRRRANSALPILDATPSIQALESFYAGRAMPATVQVTPAEQHAELDALLESHGYAKSGGTLVMTADVDAVPAATGDPAASSGWPTRAAGPPCSRR